MPFARASFPLAPTETNPQRPFLVAIAIPVFTGQLEKAREATDAANIRSAYGVVQAAALTEETDVNIKKNDTSDIKYSVQNDGAVVTRVYTAVVTLSQQQDEWQSGAQEIGGIQLAANTAKKQGTATITYNEAAAGTTADPFTKIVIAEA